MYTNNVSWFWREIKKKTKKGKTIVPIVGNSSDPKEIANLFALNYKRIYTCIKYEHNSISEFETIIDEKNKNVCKKKYLHMPF